MSTITIPNQNIPAGAERHSASQNCPDNLAVALVRMTDPTGNWDTTPGNVLIWGVQVDRGDGAGFVYLVFSQGIPFGTRERDGGLPSLQIGGTDLGVAAGNPVRLAVQTDHAINLGAVITTTPK